MCLKFLFYPIGNKKNKKKKNEFETFCATTGEKREDRKIHLSLSSVLQETKETEK